MSDINNNTNFPNLDPDNINQDTPGQNADQTNQPENDTTYWESNGAQKTYEEKDLQPSILQSSQPVHNGANETSAYSGLMSNQYQLQKKDKSSKKPLVAVLVIVCLLLATAASAFAFGSTIQNSLAMLTKSPKEYYAYVENKSVEESVDKSFALLDMSGVNEDMAAEVSGKLSYDKDTVNALLKNLSGMSISDLEATMGFSLDSIGFDSVSALKGNDMYSKFGLNLNNIDILTAELFLDYAASEVLIRLPELSPAYLKQSLDMSEFSDESFNMNSYKEATALLTSKKTADLIKRYAAIITAEIDDVELTKGESITVGDINVKANVLTVKLYPETVLNIGTKILEEAKNDDYIMEILDLYDVSKEDFNNAISEAMEEINALYDTVKDDDEFLEMDVFVGSDGKILGRKLEFITNDPNKVIVEYYNVEKGNNGAYEFYIKDDLGTKLLDVNGSHTIDKGVYNGSAVVAITPDSNEPAISFNISYEDFKIDLKKDHPYVYGKIKLSSFAMMGMEIALKYDVKDDAQLMTLYLNMGTSSLVTFETSTKYLGDFSVPTPDANAIYYDAVTEIDEYNSSVDTDEFISNLSNKLGFDIEGLFGNLLY